MIKIDDLQIRRKILDWRDEQVVHIEHHIGREIDLLLREIDKSIDNISAKELLYSQDFSDNIIKPIYEQWLENETNILLKDANQSLQIIHRTFLSWQKTETKFKPDNPQLWSTTDVVSIMAAGGSVAAGIYLRGLAITTVSGTGILGWLGLGATTMVSWPIIAVGAITIAGSILLGGNQLINLRTSVAERYKEMVHKAIREELILNANKPSLIQILQSDIRKTSDKIIQSLGEI